MEVNGFKSYSFKKALFNSLLLLGYLGISGFSFYLLVHFLLAGLLWTSPWVILPLISGLFFFMVAFNFLVRWFVSVNFNGQDIAMEKISELDPEDKIALFQKENNFQQENNDDTFYRDLEDNKKNKNNNKYLTPYFPFWKRPSLFSKVLGLIAYGIAPLVSEKVMKFLCALFFIMMLPLGLSALVIYGLTWLVVVIILFFISLLLIYPFLLPTGHNLFNFLSDLFETATDSLPPAISMVYLLIPSVIFFIVFFIPSLMISFLPCFKPNGMLDILGIGDHYRRGAAPVDTTGYLVSFLNAMTTLSIFLALLLSLPFILLYRALVEIFTFLGSIIVPFVVLFKPELMNVSKTLKIEKIKKIEEIEDIKEINKKSQNFYFTSPQIDVFSEHISIFKTIGLIMLHLQQITNNTIEYTDMSGFKPYHPMVNLFSYPVKFTINLPTREELYKNNQENLEKVIRSTELGESLPKDVAQVITDLCYHPDGNKEIDWSKALKEG